MKLGDFFTICFLQIQLCSFSFFGPCVVCALSQLLYFSHHFPHAPLLCFFFLGTTLHQGICGSKCPALGLAFTKAFSFPCASTGLHTLFLFFLAQHCIKRSLDPNVQHWDLHSLRPFHFSALLLDYTHFVFFSGTTLHREISGSK